MNEHIILEKPNRLEGERRRLNWIPAIGVALRKKVVIFSLLFLFCIPYPCLGAKKALLVGINDYKNFPAPPKTGSCTGTCDLEGPVNDVGILGWVLVEKYGFSQGDILTLTDQGASRRAIEEAFDRWLVQGTGEGDLVLFHFSGHGAQVPDFSGDEADGKDEVLCPWDTLPTGGENLILDDDLGMWLRRLKGRDVVAIIDSCHSGTATRKIRGQVVSHLEKIRSCRQRLIPVTDYHPSHLKAMPAQADEPEGVVFMAASQENQVSQEIRLKEFYFGAFSIALYDGLRNLQRPTYQRLFEHAKKVVKDRMGLLQDPRIQIEGARKEILVQSAFVPLERKKPPQPQSKPPAEPEAQPPPKPQPPVTPAEVVGERVLLALEPLEGVSRQEMEGLRKRLSGVSLVKLVSQDGFFDRLIRGKVEGGIYKVRLLNRLGDVQRVNPAGDLDELVKALRPHLEYAYMVKQLAKISHPAPPFKVELWVTDKERRDFRLGEEITFGLKSEKSCYILLINLDKEGNFHIIFPNQYAQDNFVTSDKVTEIPDQRMQEELLKKGKMYFALQFGTPTGEETVKVIATTRPLQLAEVGIGEFEETFQKISGKERTVLVKAVMDRLSSGQCEWSEATVVIRSHQ
jgi:uncharacterized caspase-like protein